MTFPNNYYSRPVYVTVKSMIVVLAESSGENRGLANLENINNVNLSEYSIAVPPTSINYVFPFS